MPRQAKTPQAADLEQSLSELENLVVELERGELPLETALQRFEQGIALTRQCQQALQQAEQKVQMLLADDQLGELPTRASGDESDA